MAKMSGGAVISTNFCGFFVLVVISADSASGYFDEYYDSSLPSSSYEYEDNLLKDLEWGFKLGSAPPGKPHSTVKTDIVNRFELGSTEHTPQQGTLMKMSFLTKNDKIYVRFYIHSFENHPHCYTFKRNEKA